MTRSTAVALTLTFVLVAAIVAGAAWQVRRDRARLWQRFASERLDRVVEAAREIEQDLEDIAEDLRFAGRLVGTADSAADRERELRALLAVVHAYRSARIVDVAGAPVLTVVDPRQPADADAAGFAAAMDETARRALALPAGRIATSPRLAADPRGWHRVFATRLWGPADAAPGAIALLVHTEPLLRRLRPLVAEPSARLLVLGAYGHPTPASDPRLAAAVEGGGPLAALAARMRGGVGGTLRIPERDAGGLGFEPGELIAAFAPIRMQGARGWSAATVASTAALAGLERALVLRLTLASAAAVLVVVAAGGYFVRAARRSAALRERARHAERLAHLHEKAEKLLDHVPAAVLALDEDGRISAANRALRDWLGKDPAGATLAEAFSRAPREAAGRLDELAAAARSSDRPRAAADEPLSLFGHEGRYRLHAVPLERRFPDARVLLVIEDLSELSALRDQLLRAEKLATIGVLAAGIAHEVGTPLGVVRGRAEYVLGKLGADHPQGAGLRVIVDQIDRVARTIRELLDFARVRPAATRPVALAAAAQGVAELVRFEAERRQVRIDVAVPERLPALAADPDQLQQLLVNLVMNACDACAPGGRVRVVGAPDGADAGGAPRVAIEVADDGCGIPAEQVHRVFDPFFTTKKRGVGTGLGLTVVGRIARNHGAEIAIDSAPGRGTRVTVRWPTARTEGHA